MSQTADERQRVIQHNLAVLNGSQPPELWSIFGQFVTIPHGSGNEAALRNFIIQKCQRLSLKTVVDKAGNLVIYVPATYGYEKVPTVVVQGHLDMVCEKNRETDFDFEHDVIRLRRGGDWLRADGTTLGADNGIGVAGALAVAFNPHIAIHGPLEILLTVDEETGLTGAKGLNDENVTGRILINVDSEEIDIVYISCAGGSGVDTTMTLKKIPVPDSHLAARLTISGLRGGHSGVDVHENRANAIKLLATALDGIDRTNSGGINLIDLKSGDKHNAIPREAEAVFAFLNYGQDTLVSTVDRAKQALQKQFPQETGLAMAITLWAKPEMMTTSECTRKAIDLLLAYPNGVLVMDQKMAGLVRTSNTVTNAKFMEDGRLWVHSSPRSSDPGDLHEVLNQIIAINNLAGATSQVEAGYPGWEPNPDSLLVKLLQKVYNSSSNTPLSIKGIHAGLECALFAEIFGDKMDMASFGPTITHPHSPDEGVYIPSVEEFWRLFILTLEAIAQGHYGK